jgi:hypothetical protein
MFHISAVKDLEYVLLSLCDLLLIPDDTFPPSMLLDSEPAIAMSQGPTYSSYSTHMNLYFAV